MNVLLFSESRILHQDDDRSAVSAVYIPLRSKTKRYTDITQPDAHIVKARYGDVDDTAALWRQDGPYVDVYGNIPLEMQERRSAVSIYLPQDFVPEGCTSFYYVFGTRWIAHGVLHVSDDGQESWGVSLLDGENGGVVDTIVSSISERILEGSAEDISVAVHKNNEAFEHLTSVLYEFDIVPEKFRKLTPSRKVKPLYIHRDFSIIMIALALCVFITMLGAVTLWVFSYLELANEREEIASMREEIMQMQSDMTLGHISNPHMILDYMKSPLPIAPSSLIHAGAETGNLFGKLNKITIGKPASTALKDQRRRGFDTGMYPVYVDVESPRDTLLHDQERIGRASFNDRPWLRSIERRQAKGDMLDLKVEVQVK